jgi:hypothetical protein
MATASVSNFLWGSVGKNHAGIKIKNWRHLQELKSGFVDKNSRKLKQFSLPHKIQTSAPLNSLDMLHNSLSYH